MANVGSKATPVAAAIVTVSDGCARGSRDDLSGQALADWIEGRGWRVAARRVVPDEIEAIQRAVRECCAEDGASLLLTTGGTGLSPRDVTPEAVRPLLEKEAPGLAELMRLRGIEKTPMASLSRSLAGVFEGCLVLCLPGSPRGAVESLEAVARVVPHAIDILQGRTQH